MDIRPDSSVAINRDPDCPKKEHALEARDQKIQELEGLLILVKREVGIASVHSNPRLIGQHLLNSVALLDNFAKPDQE